MSVRNKAVNGGLAGLVFGTAMFLGEGLYLAQSVGEVSFASVPLNVGVGAPLVLVLALFMAVACVAWSRMLGPGPGMERQAWRWLWADSTERLVQRSAWIVAAALSGAVWLAASVVAGNQILRAVVTPSLALLLLILVQFIVGALLLAGSALIALIARAFFGFIARLGRVGQYVSRPLSLLVGCALTGLSGVLVLAILRPDVLKALPWSFALGPMAGMLAVVSAALFVKRFKVGALSMGSVFMVLVLGIGVFTFFLPHALRGGRSVFVGQESVASTWYATIHPVLDFDGDGALNFYGEGDCAPFDPDIGPHQREIVGDGIDQNCSGSDLVIDEDAFRDGKRSHPLPAGLVEAKPNIILVTSDALSFDHTSVGGYKRDVTPNLNDWAKRATVFESAFSTSTSTRLALPGLLTSQFNSMTPMKNARVHPYHYANNVVTIASLLKEAGYQTIHVPGNRYFARWNGYTRGFDTLDFEAHKQHKEHTSVAVTASALKFLQEHDPKKGPMFLWIHYYDHHEPYVMPADGKIFGDGKAEVDRYDSEIHHADGNWAKVLDAVEQKWTPEEYVMVFTSDHGEGFDVNHTRFRHGNTVHTATLHVPFIIQTSQQRGKRFDGLTGHLDLLPTLANIVGTKPLESWRGESLVPVLFEGKPIEKTITFSLEYIPEGVKRKEDGFRQIGARTNDFYFIDNRRAGETRFVKWREDATDSVDVRAKYPDEFEIYRYITAGKLEWLREHEKALSAFRPK
ncbi:MAG: sulfatase-like hydrolase/transferase [Bradymonadaceae bacterium]|nr:sulfatase-like hydrolase/transferase [Lujinxingiaceae bacterium]